MIKDSSSQIVALIFELEVGYSKIKMVTLLSHP
jgi:hypothetical protein